MPQTYPGSVYKVIYCNKSREKSSNPEIQSFVPPERITKITKSS